MAPICSFTLLPGVQGTTARSGALLSGTEARDRALAALAPEYDRRLARITPQDRTELQCMLQEMLSPA